MRRGLASVALPAPCGHCAPQGGLWRVGLRGGMERCGCARGAALGAADAERATSRGRPAKRAFVANLRDGKAMASGE